MRSGLPIEKRQDSRLEIQAQSCTVEFPPYELEFFDRYAHLYTVIGGSHVQMSDNCFP